MFKKSLNEEKLEAVILEVTEKLSLTKSGTEEYAVLTEQLANLYSIQNDIKKNKDKVSMDTLFIAGANLAGILAIVNYERLNVVTSKAFQLLLKIR